MDNDAEPLIKIYENIYAERVKEMERQLSMKIAIDASFGPLVAACTSILGASYFGYRQIAPDIDTSIESGVMILSFSIFAINVMLIGLEFYHVFVKNTVYQDLAAPITWDQYLDQLFEHDSLKDNIDIKMQATRVFFDYTKARIEKFSEAISAVRKTNAARGEHRHKLIKWLTVGAIHVLVLCCVSLANQIRW